MNTRTIRLHRVLRAKPEKVYRAFPEPDALSKWLPPQGSPGRAVTLHPGGNLSRGSCPRPAHGHSGVHGSPGKTSAVSAESAGA